jgi:hypothetical protein
MTRDNWVRYSNLRRGNCQPDKEAEKTALKFGMSHVGYRCLRKSNEMRSSCGRIRKHSRQSCFQRIGSRTFHASQQGASISKALKISSDRFRISLLVPSL